MSEPKAKKRRLKSATQGGPVRPLGRGGASASATRASVVRELTLAKAVDVLGSRGRRRVLDAFLHPIGAPEFFASVWKKKALAVHAPPARFAALVEEHLHDMDLGMLLDATPSEQIHCWVKEHARPAASSATTPSSTHSVDCCDSITVDDPRTAQVLHLSGASLYFRAPQVPPHALPCD